MVIVLQTLNMPQPSIDKGLEACYVNRLIDLAIFLFLTACGQKKWGRR